MAGERAEFDAPDVGAIVGRMEAFAPALVALLAGLPDEDARWKPPSGAWSILEVVCHLADEEVEDFRARLRSTLEAPSRAWAGIDPEGAASERRYNERDLRVELSRFAREREESVRWLRSLHDARWENAHAHPKFGAISAAALLASWSAHDALHLRQIAKRLYELSGRDGNGASTGYAGAW